MKGSKALPRLAVFTDVYYGSTKRGSKAVVLGNPREILYDYSEGEVYTAEFNIIDTSTAMTNFPYYYAVDDDDLRRHDILVGPHRDIIEDEIPQQNKCTRTSFHRAYYPNCNSFHEINVCFDPGDGYLR
jgi:hypothetical protein